MHQLNDVTVSAPDPRGTPYADVPSGTWFWGWGNAAGIPMLRTENGYVSPVNGHVELDSSGYCYFLGKNVLPCPEGTVVTISVGTRKI